VEKTLDHSALIERDDDQARPGNAGRFENPLPASVAKDDFVAQLCFLKTHQVRLHRDVGNLCCFQNEGDEAAHAPAATKKYVISKTLAFFADDSPFGGFLATMRRPADKLSDLRALLNQNGAKRHCRGQGQEG
jgi:hypothetical protein